MLTQSSSSRHHNHHNHHERLLHAPRTAHRTRNTSSHHTTLMETCTWRTDEPSRFHLPLPDCDRGPRRVFLLAPHTPDMCANHDFLAHFNQFVIRTDDGWTPVDVGSRDVEWEQREEERQKRHRAAFEKLGSPMLDWEFEAIKNHAMELQAKPQARHGGTRPKPKRVSSVTPIVTEIPALVRSRSSASSLSQSSAEVITPSDSLLNSGTNSSRTSTHSTADVQIKPPSRDVAYIQSNSPVEVEADPMPIQAVNVKDVPSSTSPTKSPTRRFPHIRFPILRRATIPAGGKVTNA